MIDSRRGGPLSRARLLLISCLFVLAGAAPALPQAQEPCDLADLPDSATAFPRIPLCVFAGAYRDSSLIEPQRCVGSFAGPLAQAVQARARTVTVRFKRDRKIEARPDFGGYRIYRVETFTGLADSSRLMLIRRFSRQPGDERTWNFSVVDPVTLQFKCKVEVVNDSIVTFVDPDSDGTYVHICRLRTPPDDFNGRCDSPGDSIVVLRAPPGPHDGFRLYYSITYEAKNQSGGGAYAEMVVPDSANCVGGTCPNLNNKLRNISTEPVEPTGGPTANLERVIVVPNPFRGRAPWDTPGNNEVHFLNLPTEARIRIFTVAGDLIAELHHADPIRDFERWNLKNNDGRDVTSGIYMYRVEASNFSFQDRFIVIR
jgi:hypothetical protein